MRSVPAEILAVATILRKLPFYEDQRTLRIPGGPAVLIKHHQIIVWVSITQAGLSECPVDARRFRQFSTRASTTRS